MKWLSLEDPAEQHSLGPSTFLTAKFRQNEPYSEKKKYEKTGEQKWRDQKNLSKRMLFTVLLSCVAS